MEFEHQPQLIYPADQVVDSSYFASRLPDQDIPIKVIRVPGSNRDEAEQYVTDHYLLTQENERDRDAIQRNFAKSLREYNEDTVLQGTSGLRDHQTTVFSDTADHFASGEKKGYIKLPTGTGKTVIFVKTCQALLRAPEELRPRILVVTPTKDLVHQTDGQDVEKGFNKFAPEISVSTYFSDTKEKPDDSRQDKLKRSQVTITTYRSFSLMFENDVESDFLFEYDSSEEGNFEQRSKRRRFRLETNEKVIDMFDVVIFDEAHRTEGEKTADRVAKLEEKGVTLLGFTATPDYEDERKLSDVLGNAIHSMDIREAIDQRLLAPLISFGITSNISIGRKAFNGSTGQYQDRELLDFLGYSDKRNALIVEAAKQAIEAGQAPIISCLAGRNLYHPRHIASLLNQETIIDPKTGESRLARVVVVDSSVEMLKRKKIYDAFEKGDIDGLTFINVLTEGWDSDRAKALINARPTRSKVFGQQRLGRILRLTEDNQPAIVIDIVDHVDDDEYYPVNSSDLVDGVDTDIGQVFVQEDAEELEQLEAFSLDFQLRLENAGLNLSPLSARYSRYQKNLQELTAIHPKKAPNKEIEIFEPNPNNPDQTVKRKYIALGRINEGEYIKGINTRLLEKLEAKTDEPFSFIEHRVGLRFFDFYLLDQLQDSVEKLPEINPNKYALDTNGVKWVTIEGLEKLLAPHFPGLDTQLIERTLIDLYEAGKLDYEPQLVKYFVRIAMERKLYGITELYHLDTYKLVGTYLLQNKE